MAALLLTGFWFWGRYESKLESSLAKQYKPLPLPKNPQYTAKDVSVVVATIETPDTFPDCLRQWLRNGPKEIIIVTIQRDLPHVLRLVAQVPKAKHCTRVLTAEVANKREQLAVGIRVAESKFLALVDDDAFWPAETVLPYLLAGFEDPKVGGTQGMQSAHIPEKKCRGDLITPWEVASVRSLDTQNRIQAVRFAADGGCFSLIGRTMLVRSEILKDEDFIHAMCNDYWGGNKLNTGDDCFISRWMMDKNWKFHIQNAPEAEITTLVPDDSSLWWQMVRWKRSSLQSCWTILFHAPGFWRFYRAYPYTGRKLVERLFTPVLTWLHIWAWITALRQTPTLALVLLLWYIHNWIHGYRAFVERFPWCGQKIWAAFLFDNCYPIVDLYGWWTLNKEGWLTRKE